MAIYETVPFSKEDYPRSTTVEYEVVTGVSRATGAAIRSLREGSGVSHEQIAAWLNLTVSDLIRAENGQLIEVTRRGELIDKGAMVLMMLATLFNLEYIPNPAIRR